MLQIEPISAFSDNYIWCLRVGASAWVVDPGDAEPVMQFLSARTLKLDGILVTHHHADHIGGLDKLRAQFPAVTIYGPHNPAIAQIDVRLRDGDAIEVLGEYFRVLEVPGHTLDHIAYISQTASPPLLLCGDTLFAAGCGRLFEGTAQQMFTSLKKLRALNTNTRVFCAHEYTEANLRFARAVEPDNLATKQRAESVERTRALNQPTLPSTLELELATNPFLRTDQPEVRAAALRHSPQSADEVDVFAAIRRWKDKF